MCWQVQHHVYFNLTTRITGTTTKSNLNLLNPERAVVHTHTHTHTYIYIYISTALTIKNLYSVTACIQVNVLFCHSMYICDLYYSVTDCTYVVCIILSQYVYLWSVLFCHSMYICGLYYSVTACIYGLYYSVTACM
jgi:hypothetical protein